MPNEEGEELDTHTQKKNKKRTAEQQGTLLPSNFTLKSNVCKKIKKSTRKLTYLL